MKIYPNKHNPVFCGQISSLELPLGYIQNDDENRIISVEIESAFQKPAEETPLRPYRTLPSNDVLLFDATGKPIWNTEQYVQQKDGVWTVLPQNVKEFYPKEFTYDILIERDDVYTKSAKYDISICFNWEPEGTDNIKRALASLIQNQGKAQRYPSNIVLNGGDITLMMLANLMRLKDTCDLYFCPGDTAFADIDAMLDNHTNLWLYDNSFNGLIETSNEAEDGYYFLTDNTIFSSGSGYLLPRADDNKYVFFDRTKTWSSIADNEEYELIDLFTIGSPLKIYKKQNGGFVVLSHPSFLENLNSVDDDSAHLRLFFEVLLYIYLHGYYQTNTRTSWITDETIDFYLNPNQPYYLSHPKISLPRILTEEGYNTQHTYHIVEVSAVPKEVADIPIFKIEYVGTNRFQELLFKKTALTSVKDPAKGNNILVYTMNHSLLICNLKDVSTKLIETGITVRLIDERHIGISATKSSAYKIYTETEQILEINNLGTFRITYDDGIFSVNKPGILIAHGTVQINTDIIYRDIRRLGGGEASETPNYEMIDTGHLYGRPYRYGCPIIIKLPARYEPMASEIRSEVEKHIASGDYPIILYED